MKYFVSYFFRKDNINRGFGNAEVTIEEKINYDLIKQIQKQIEAKYEMNQVTLLYYLELEEEK